MFLYILSIVDDTVHQNYWLAGQLQGILGMQTEILLPMFCLRDFFIRPTYPFCAPCAYFGYMWALPKMYRKTWSERVKAMFFGTIPPSSSLLAEKNPEDRGNHQLLSHCPLRRNSRHLSLIHDCHDLRDFVQETGKG